MENSIKSIKGFTSKIKKITIKNEGIIKSVDLKFSDGLNIIMGSGGSGKTTVLKAIEKAKKENVIIKYPSCDPWAAKGEKIMLLFSEINNKHVDKCFLIDDLLGYLDRIKLEIALKNFEKSKNQIIITMWGSDHVKIPNVANVINTKDFEKHVKDKGILE